MLLAVEGGGFFSSSASGYSKGLTLLFLGQKNNEEMPMRVTPWNQYQLVDGEPDLDLPVDSGKTLFVRGCASFVCFGGAAAAAGPESPSPLKPGPARQQEVVPQSLVSEDGMSREEIHSAADGAHNTTKCNPKVTLRSSLKKPSKTITVNANDSDDRKALHSEECEVPDDEAQRKVQWADTYGGELFDVREFEPSEDNGSDDDDDLNGGAGKTCSCKIM